jgi:hypothetical protein
MLHRSAPDIAIDVAAIAVPAGSTIAFILNWLPFALHLLVLALTAVFIFYGIRVRRRELRDERGFDPGPMSGSGKADGGGD